VKFDENRQPHHVVVHLDDPVLYRCPMLFMENIERLRFTESEVTSLRDYLKKADSCGLTISGAAPPGTIGRASSRRLCADTLAVMRVFPPGTAE